jgi:FkbM family methyltransferase
MARTIKLTRSYSTKKLQIAISSLPDFNGVTYVDVGAAGNFSTRWSQIKNYIKYVGFEPDERSYQLLKKGDTNFKSYQVYPFALSHSTLQQKLYFCRKSEVTSTYEPNYEFLKFFPGVERFEVINTEMITTTRLDDVPVNCPDFIKLDIQGGELNALLGAEKKLKCVFGLELEVEFLQIYKDQPLFGEIVRDLNHSGFQFLDFIEIIRWERKGISRETLFGQVGQAIFADALFLKSPEVFFSEIPTKSKVSSYFLTLLLYGRFDLLETSFGMLNEIIRQDFDQFVLKVEVLSGRHEKFLKLNRYYNFVLSFFGFTGRSHLLY